MVWYGIVLYKQKDPTSQLKKPKMRGMPETHGLFGWGPQRPHEHKDPTSWLEKPNTRGMPEIMVLVGSCYAYLVLCAQKEELSRSTGL